MSTVLGPNTRGVLHLISHLGRLSGGQVDAVAAAWRRQSAQARARAWAGVTHATDAEQRPAVLAAAALARHEAMTTAADRDREDWGFWAAAWDAAAAVAVGGLIADRDYQVLVAPVAGVLPWVAGGVPDRVEAAGLQAAIGRMSGAGP